MITEHNIVNILLLSLTASLGAGIGGLIAVIRKPGKRLYGLLMGMTAGVMICLSFLELVNQVRELAGPWMATLGFGIGVTLMFLLDYYAPPIRFHKREISGSKIEVHNALQEDNRPRKYRLEWRQQQNQILDQALVNTGLLLAVGITLHNLPEGIAVGADYLHNPKFGLFLVIAILLCNISERIATALPLCRGGVCR